MPENTEFLTAYNAADVDLVVESEMSRVARYNHHSQPTATLLAGQPGAGKTVLSSMLNKDMRDDVYFINADEYRRYHPNYRKLFETHGSDSVQLTAKFSGEVTERLIWEASERKINLIIEGTGRTTEVPHNTAELLVRKGYRVELAVIATRPEQSLCSTLLRFYEMNEGGTLPRATAAAAHDHVVAVLPDNLDILRNDPVISIITIWNRVPEKVYDSREDFEAPSEVLNRFWFRPWSEEEYQTITRTIETLRKKEEKYHLGQMAAIDELDRRVQAVTHDFQPSFEGMTML